MFKDILLSMVTKSTSHLSFFFYHNSMAPPFDTVIFGFFPLIRFGEKRSQITFYMTRMQGILMPTVNFYIYFYFIHYQLL